MSDVKKRKVRKTKKKDVIRRAVKVRLYPTQQQEVQFAQTFGNVRFIWNAMLKAAQANHVLHGSYAFPTPASFKDEYPFLRLTDSLALANAQMNLQQAFVNHFKNPKHFGLPRFKKKFVDDSYTTNVVGSNLTVDGDHIKLPKIGWVKAKVHRHLEGWTLKSATVSRKGTRYYASLLYESPEEKPVPVAVNDELKAIGLDYKSDGFYVDSNGNSVGSPKYFRQSEKKLAKLQHELSRKGYGSKNWLKQKAKVDRMHEHIANQRKDFLHKLSTETANQYDVVCVETLNLNAMKLKRGFRLGKATSDNGWGKFVEMLSYKLFERGKYLIKVDRFFASSQTCSVCGMKNPAVKDLSIRIWDCPHCGAHHDRDHNAAINIREEGLRMLAAGLV